MVRALQDLKGKVCMKYFLSGRSKYFEVLRHFFVNTYEIKYLRCLKFKDWLNSFQAVLCGIVLSQQDSFKTSLRHYKYIVSNSLSDYWLKVLKIIRVSIGEIIYIGKTGAI